MTPSPSPDPGLPVELRHTFHVVRDGSLGERCAELLIAAGMSVTVDTALASDFSTIRPEVVTVLATDHPRPLVALRLDDVAWQAGAPWTSGTMVAHEFRVGPSIIPSRTPCFECWSRRVRSLVPDIAAYDALETFAGTNRLDTWFRGQLDPLTDQVAALLAAEAVALSMRVAASTDSARVGRVWEGDAIAGALRVRRFASIGTCSRCSVRNQTGCALADYFVQQPLVSHSSLALAGHEDES